MVGAGGGGEGLAGQVWVDGGRGLVKQVGEDWGLVVGVDRGGGLVEQVGGGRDRAQKAPLVSTKNSKQIKDDDVAAADNQTISTDYLEKIWKKVERENMRECKEMKYIELRAWVNEWDRMWVLLCEWVSYRESESVRETERKNDELCITAGAMSFPHFLEIVRWLWQW